MNHLYTRSEHKTWALLLSRRLENIEKEACDIWLEGLANLKLPLSCIPDYQELNQTIQQYTDWKLFPAEELITAVAYFRMLSNCQFPAITSIRPRKEIDFYTSPKPDVVHEYLGHGPYLTNKKMTKFMQKLATLATEYTPKQQVYLGRLFWFTIEFGLIETPKGLRAYGAGILPSQMETWHALSDSAVERRPFDLAEILRTPFSAVRKQRIYYVLPDFDTLYDISRAELSSALAEASESPLVCS